MWFWLNSTSLMIGFLWAVWHAIKMSSDLPRMMRLKFITTFFQTVELTAAMLQQPDWLYITMPFSAHFFGCPGRSLELAFYPVVYIPVALFAALYWRIRSAPTSDPAREKYTNALIFLLTLWYLPVVRYAMLTLAYAARGHTNDFPPTSASLVVHANICLRRHRVSSIYRVQD